MIEKPRFLDEPATETCRDPNSASEQKDADGSKKSAKLSKPVLLDADPEGPDTLPPVEPAQRVQTPSSSIPTSVLLFLALGGLVLTWLVLSDIAFVIREYRLAHLLGVAGGLLSGLCFAIIAFVLLREYFSWRELGEIDKLRAIISSPISGVNAVAGAARDWVDLISASLDEPNIIKATIKSSESADEIRSLLRSKVVYPLNDSVENCAKQAVLQIVAITAVCPHPSWDGLVIIVRSALMVRQIARLFGMRPGLAATLSIMRHVVLTAAGTMTAISVGGRLFGGLAKGTPYIKDVIESAGIGGTESTRIWSLAKLTAEVCCPVPKH